MSNDDEQELLCILKNLEMEQDMIDKFLDNIRSGRCDNGKKILKSYRSKLLTDVHLGQDKLYQIDFLIRNL